MNKKIDVTVMAQMSLLSALMVIMAFTPLGYIPLPFMNATTMHIPVIIGACLLGPKMGGILGALFGITSMVKATLQPIITSFVFTPFYSFNEQFHGGFNSIIVAVVPRILIGVIAGLVFQWLMKVVKNKTISLAIAGFIGSMVNTIGVMGLIYLLFGGQYSEAIGQSSDLLFKFIMGVVGVNGVPEAIIAAVLTAAVGKALMVVIKKNVSVKGKTRIA